MFLVHASDGMFRDVNKRSERDTNKKENNKSILEK